MTHHNTDTDTAKKYDVELCCLTVWLFEKLNVCPCVHTHFAPKELHHQLSLPAASFTVMQHKLAQLREIALHGRLLRITRALLRRGHGLTYMSRHSTLL